MKNLVFPFTAIVGQEKVKKALVLNAINPAIGGVLIKGDKGTGKTTAVRALADLLPSIRTVKGCPFNCDPDEPESAYSPSAQPRTGLSDPLTSGRP